MSDSKFEYIDDVLLNVDKDKIEKKKKSPIKPLALLILGAAILWYGANYINTAQSDTLRCCSMGSRGIFGKERALRLQTNRKGVEET